MNASHPQKVTPSHNTFWSSPSTWIVTAIRVAILLLSHTGTATICIPDAWLYSPSLTSILIKPALTLSHVREAVAVQRLSSGGRFADSFQSNRIQLPPLVLAAMTPLAQSSYGEFYLAILCLLVDVGIATMIEYLGRVALFTNRIEAVDHETAEQERLPEAIRPLNSHTFAVFKQTDSSKALISMESLPMLAAKLYYWSPATVLSGSVYACFQNLAGFFLVATFWEAVRRGGSLWLSTFFLALATYLELHHVVFLVPLVVLPRSRSQSLPMLLSFAIWFICLQGLSYLLVGPKFVQVLQATYGLGWKTIRPNLSVQWYLAMQLFSRFRHYFGALLLGLPYIVVIPIAVRLYDYPLVLVRLIIKSSILVG